MVIVLSILPQVNLWMLGAEFINWIKCNAKLTGGSSLTVFRTLWKTILFCRYYHEKNHFYRLMGMLSNEVVTRAKSLVNNDIFDKLDEVCEVLFRFLQNHPQINTVWREKSKLFCAFWHRVSCWISVEGFCCQKNYIVSRADSFIFIQIGLSLILWPFSCK